MFFTLYMKQKNNFVFYLLFEYLRILCQSVLIFSDRRQKLVVRTAILFRLIVLVVFILCHNYDQVSLYTGKPLISCPTTRIIFNMYVLILVSVLQSALCTKLA